MREQTNRNWWQRGREKALVVSWKEELETFRLKGLSYVAALGLCLSTLLWIVNGFFFCVPVIAPSSSNRPILPKDGATVGHQQVGNLKLVPKWQVIPSAGGAAGGGGARTLAPESHPRKAVLMTDNGPEEVRSLLLPHILNHTQFWTNFEKKS